MFRLYIIFLLCLLISGPTHALELKGSLSQGGFIIGKTVPGAKVLLDGVVLKLTEDGHFVFGFGRDQKPEAMLEVHSPDGEGVERKALSIKQREYKIQHIDGLPGKMVSPPEGVWEKIASDRKDVANARAKTLKTTTPYFLRGFKAPGKGQVTGVYGSQRILNGKPKQPHYGIDYAGPTGTPVYAPADGIIRLAHPDMYYTGKTVIIDHGFGVSSTLMHMSAISVNMGDVIKQGDEIGAIGMTGRATGPHLDWRMNWHNERIDPALVLEATTIN